MMAEGEGVRVLIDSDQEQLLLVLKDRLMIVINRQLLVHPVEQNDHKTKQMIVILNKLPKRKNQDMQYKNIRRIFF